MTKQTIDQAVGTIFYECMQDRNTKTGYKRLVKSLQTLGVSLDQIPESMFMLGYHDRSNKPHDWLKDGKK